ncbi:MAG: methionyl-tRNA formyltransferase [Rhodanobacteraceae bacterium]|nr:methionyl-tRNA formyltransferase [Rhodanobacteraceae bacterium]
MSLRVVFAGTPDFAVPCLDAVLGSGADCVAVYTQPDRPAGRGRQLQPSPVKQRALQAGLPVEQPLTLKEAQVQSQLAAYAPDLMIVVAYGLILPRAVLALPRLGCWNVHASLLPRWRGAAPIQRAILAGDAETGVDLMQMEAGLDTGPVLLQRRTPIAADDSSGRLHDRLAGLGAELLREGLGRVLAGETLSPRPQSEDGVCYAHKLEKSEALLDWQQSAAELDRKIRAFSPWPVAEAVIAGERVRIHAAEPVEASGTPGEPVHASRSRLVIACGEGALALLRLQRAGGRVIDATDYVNARPELKR